MGWIAASCCGIACLAAAAWAIVALRIYLNIKAFWPLAPVEQPSEARDAIDVVIAARNEEEHIGVTLEALVHQDYQNLTVTVVDDQSTDATSAVVGRVASRNAAGHAIRLIGGVSRPAGWVGKTWAVYQGVKAATADWLLFVDADIRLHPAAVSTAMEHARNTGADLVSLLPRPECRTFWQSAIGLSVVQLLAQRYPLNRVNDSRRATALASGGFILVKRQAYERAGGHGRLRRAIMDDIELARRVKLTGGKLAVVAAPELARTHMYGSFSDIWRGLRKNAYAVMNYRFYKYAIGTLLGLMLAIGPWLGLAAGVATHSVPVVAAGVLGILLQAIASYPFTRFLRLPATMALSVPIGLTCYLSIVTASVWHHVRGRVLWKDRVFTTKDVKVRIPYRVGGNQVRAESGESLPSPHGVQSATRQASAPDRTIRS